MNGGLFISCISSPCSERNIQFAVSAQTLKCLEQAKPTSWNMPCSMPDHLMKFHLTEFKAFLKTLPAVWPIYILLPMELPHSAYMMSELKRENNAINSQAVVFTKKNWKDK